MAIFRNLPQRQTQILILEILQCIPVVKIFVFLDLAKTISFLDGHYLAFAPAEIMRSLLNAPLRPISVLHSDFNPQNIQYIPVVNPAKAGLMRLDLERN